LSVVHANGHKRCIQNFVALYCYMLLCSCQCVFAGVGHIAESVVTVVDGGVCCYLFFYHLSLLVSR